MMRKIVKIFCIVIIIGLIFLLIKKSEAEDRPFNQIELSGLNVINNGIFPSYYDTVLSVAMDQMGLHGYVVTIGKLTDEARSQFDGNLKAHVRYFNSNFYLFTDLYSRKEILEILSHEVIHMSQYASGELIYNENEIIWKGEYMDLNSEEYEERPWESDAFSKQYNLIELVEGKLWDN